MKHIPALILGLAVTVAGSTSAFADSIFDFTFTAPGYSGQGQFDTTPRATAGRYTIVDVSGYVDTGNGKHRPITGVLAPGAFEDNDNILFFPARPSGAFFDVEGVSFVLRNGAEVNLFARDGSFLMRANGNTLEETAAITVAPAVPEPSSLVLLGTGLVGTFGAARRRFARA